MEFPVDTPTPSPLSGDELAELMRRYGFSSSRTRNGLDVGLFAEHLQVSVQAVYRWLKGEEVPHYVKIYFDLVKRLEDSHNNNG